MSLYLVRNPAGAPAWVAHEDDEMRIWSYVHHTGKFHLNQGLYLDFYFDHTNTYEPITADAAQKAIQEGLGTLDTRTGRHLIERFQADLAARTVRDVLGAALEETQR